jgi:hypothetical protein
MSSSTTNTMGVVAAGADLDRPVSLAGLIEYLIFLEARL